MDEVTGRLSGAWRLMMELFPYLIHRLAIYAVSAALMIGYWVVVLFASWFLGKISETLGSLILLVGLVGNAGILWLARDYLLYLVKAGYVACATEMLTVGRIPAGMTQTEFGTRAVKARFKEVSALAVLDKLISGTIGAFNRTVEDVASWIPLPGLDQVVAVVNAVIKMATSVIDEAILSLVFVRKDENPWTVARDGLVLYAQNWKPILKVAAAVALIDWISTATVLVMAVFFCGVGTLAVVRDSWTTLKFLGGFVMPVMITYVVRLALIEPLVTTAVLVTFHQVIKGQQPDPQWTDKLDAVSSQFREIREKATSQAPQASKG